MPKPKEQRAPNRGLRTQIELARNNLLDMDVVVDDLRLAIDRHVEELRVVVRERDREASSLLSLIELYDQAVAETFGPEIATLHAARLTETAAGR